LEPLGLDHRSFAAHVGLDPERVYAILSGAQPLDADAAVRFGRALGAPAETLMQMQLRYDFAVARERSDVSRLEPVRPSGPPSFPAHGFLKGRLRRTPDGFGEGSLFFQEDVPKRSERDLHAGLHALWFGDRLRVYEPRGTAIWTGPVLQNLDGRILLPYERPAVWNAWFASGFRADLAIGEEHRAFFSRMEV
jgi:addiction module HigA family antidote